MKIYVISLANAVARRAQTRQQLEDHDLEFEFLDALDGIDGSQLFDRIDSHAHLVHTGRLPTPGEIGCYASHLKAWHGCIADSHPVCVLEDDCQLQSFFAAALAAASKLIEQYGFIRLQTESRGRKYPVRDAGRFQLHRYTKMPHSTLAYVISPRVARRFIDCSKVMSESADVFVKQFWVHDQPLYGLTPYAATEGPLSNTPHISGRKRTPKSLLTRIIRIGIR
ncbi:MAG: glycosyltransferase family 25 protein, partial [Gammaproteobacteria bacterium]|nr:glycosyltransferase family 25 protein [Gammaproteobacteria bacterium]